MTTEIGCDIKVTFFAHIISAKNKSTGERKRVVVLDNPTKDWTDADDYSGIFPSGFAPYYMSHLVGKREDYPKLDKLLGNQRWVELPENRNLWYDR
jgi:hypothetical protein